MLRENTVTSDPREDNRTLATGASLAGVVPTSSPGTIPSSACEPRAARASTRNNPNDDGDIQGILNERQLRQLKSLASVGPSSDFAHNEEYPSSVTAFAYAAGSSNYTGLTGEETNAKTRIPISYGDAINSLQGKAWQKSNKKEMTSLTGHEVYDLVAIISVPKGQNTIGSRFVFKQKADGRFKARLAVQGYAQEAGIDYGKTLHQCAVSAGSVCCLL